MSPKYTKKIKQSKLSRKKTAISDGGGFSLFNPCVNHCALSVFEAIPSKAQSIQYIQNVPVNAWKPHRKPYRAQNPCPGIIKQR
jgi:hypothetical protein